MGKAPGRWAWGTGSRACSAWGVLGWLQKNNKRFALILCKTTVKLFRWQTDIYIPIAILLQKPPARGEGVWVPEPGYLSFPRLVRKESTIRMDVPHQY